jgi:hypothetical protein
VNHLLVNASKGSIDWLTSNAASVTHVTLYSAGPDMVKIDDNSVILVTSNDRCMLHLAQDWTYTIFSQGGDTKEGPHRVHTTYALPLAEKFAVTVEPAWAKNNAMYSEPGMSDEHPYEVSIEFEQDVIVGTRTESKLASGDTKSETAEDPSDEDGRDNNVAITVISEAHARNFAQSLGRAGRACKWLERIKVPYIQ